MIDDSLFGDNYLGLTQEELRRRKEEELSLLEGTGQQVLGGLGMAATFLDTPGHIVRSILGGSNPLTGLFNADKRFYGDDLLESWGIDNNPTGIVGELGIEILTDPLTWLTGGLGAMSRSNQATKALGKLGVLRKASDIVPMGRKKALDILDTAREGLARSSDFGNVLIPADAFDLEALKKAAQASDKLLPRELDHIDDWLEFGLKAEEGVNKTGIGHRKLRRMMTPGDVLDRHQTLVQYE